MLSLQGLSARPRPRCVPAFARVCMACEYTWLVCACVRPISHVTQTRAHLQAHRHTHRRARARTHTHTQTHVRPKPNRHINKKTQNQRLRHGRRGEDGGRGDGGFDEGGGKKKRRKREGGHGHGKTGNHFYNAVDIKGKRRRADRPN